MTPDEARARLLALGLDADAAEVMFDHFADSERRGKLGHGFSRIPWLETQGFDLAARPVKGASGDGVEHWDANGALGYLTLAAICDDVIREGVVGAKLIVASGCFPTGALGYWARRVATAGYVAVLTATSPRRLPPPAGGPPLTGTNPLAIAIPSSDGEPLVTDVSMGAVTHGDVIAGHARPEELVPFGASSPTRRLRSRSGSSSSSRRSPARTTPPCCSWRARSTTSCPASVRSPTECGCRAIP